MYQAVDGDSRQFGTVGVMFLQNECHSPRTGDPWFCLVPTTKFVTAFRTVHKLIQPPKSSKAMFSGSTPRSDSMSWTHFNMIGGPQM